MPPNLCPMLSQEIRLWDALRPSGSRHTVTSRATKPHSWPWEALRPSDLQVLDQDLRTDISGRTHPKRRGLDLAALTQASSLEAIGLKHRHSCSTGTCCHPTSGYDSNTSLWQTTHLPRYLRRAFSHWLTASVRSTFHPTYSLKYRTA